MVNASWLGALTQSETAKYFKWIIVINVFYLRYFILQLFIYVQMSETSSIQTKRNRKQFCTVKLIKYVRQLTFFFNVKMEKFVGGNINLSHLRCLASGGGI